MIRRALNSIVGFHPDRTIPRQSSKTFVKWFAQHTPHVDAGKVGNVLLFADEFTNYNDVDIGIKTVQLLEQLGYRIEIPELLESGRTWISKGFLRKAKTIVNENTRRLHERIGAERPLIGIEPSAILTLRDEAIDLADAELKSAAQHVATHSMMLDEFIAREAEAGRVTADSFTDDPCTIKFHGHCFQKSLSGIAASVAALRVPRNYSVQPIESGCCGMAGSFGYEEEHYEISMKIGELVLFPAVRSADQDVLVVAPGTSCRHQIHDGTGKRAFHPAEVLHAALK